MHAIIWRLMFLAVAFLWATSAHAQKSFDLPSAPEPLTLTAQEPKVNLASAIWVLEDASGKLGFDAVLQPQMQDLFKPWDARQGDLNLSFSRSAWWIRVSLQRESQARSGWILDVPYAYNKHLDFYAPQSPGVFTGHAHPITSKPIFGRHYAFPIHQTEEPSYYYFRVASNYAISFPLIAWQPAEYAKHTLENQLLEALYHGALLALVIYAFFIWVSTRDQRFGLYALYGTGLNLAIFSGNGWGNVFVWTTWHQFDEVSSGIFLNLTGTALLLFSRSFLHTRQLTPRVVDRTILAGAVLALGHAVAMLLCMDQAPWISVLYQALFGFSGLYVVLIGVALWFTRHHQQPGKPFFIASLAVLTCGIAVATLRVFGGLPTTGLTSYALQISTAIEMLILSFTLSSIVRHERQERIAAQANTIDLLKSQEQRLHQAVDHRTKALLSTVERERKTLSEYLRFSALVSHEFRSSLSVISGQADMVRKEATNGSTTRRTDIIRQHVDRLAQMADTWLKSDQIVNSAAPLRIEAIDCNTWLPSFLAKHPQYQEHHDIHWHVHPHAPVVHAEPALLEIAILNLIDNACKYAPPGSTVEVRVVMGEPGSAQASTTGLQVQDKGHGIEASLQEHIFEHYFRVNHESAIAGTGLGLSFVKHIADRHQGQITLVSEPGVGSTFTLWFPQPAQG
jgi:two-component system, sensor histidine kinase LadS